MAKVSRTRERQRIHAILFDGVEPTLRAVRLLRRDGYGVVDVRSPFPVHGLDEAMGLRETRLPYATLVGALLGGGLLLALAIWVHTTDWPVTIGGKPGLAIPAFIPVVFETTILLAAIATVGGFIYGARLRPRWRYEDLPPEPDDRVADDLFAVLVAESDAAFDVERFRGMVEGLSPVDVVEGWRVQ
jgi:hypothetical protein